MTKAEKRNMEEYLYEREEQRQHLEDNKYVEDRETWETVGNKNDGLRKKKVLTCNY